MSGNASSYSLLVGSICCADLRMGGLLLSRGTKNVAESLAAWSFLAGQEYPG
ncbi:MAG: hypothetical protein M3P47_05150 [Pseudomonadota bacterium]|nr:hypothetical protein [Pseudomonadota bacterium]